VVGARPPYGYQVKSEPHKSWLEIDEEEAKIVRMVFDWYISGNGNGKPMTIYQIQQKLIAMGIPTRGDKEVHVAKKRPHGIWSDAMIRHILKNETYTGVWYFGKTKMVSDGKEHTRKQKSKCGFGKQVARSRDEWIPVEVPAIISVEDFNQVKERLMNNQEQAKRNTRHEYLLSRRLRCAKCGYTFVGMTRREKHMYYRCNGAWRTTKVCDVPLFRVPDVDHAVWEWLRNTLLHPENIAIGLQNVQQETIRANQALYDRLDLIQGRIEDTIRQQAKLLDLYLSDNFPKEMLQERKARLEETLSNLRKEQADISSHLQTTVLSDDQIEDIKAFCDEIRDRLDNATFEQKRQLIDMLDVRGTLAIENEEKVVYVKCHLGQQLVSVARILPLSSIGGIATTPSAFHPTARSQ